MGQNSELSSKNRNHGVTIHLLIPEDCSGWKDGKHQIWIEGKSAGIKKASYQLSSHRGYRFNKNSFDPRSHYSKDSRRSSSKRITSKYYFTFINRELKKEDHVLTLTLLMSQNLNPKIHTPERSSQWQQQNFCNTDVSPFVNTLTSAVLNDKQTTNEEWKRTLNTFPSAKDFSDLRKRACSASMDRSSPSLSSFRDTSPVLACLAKSQERGNTSPDPEQQKVLMASLTKAMKRRSPSKQDEFWESLKSHYNYLMDEGLIKSCKEANGELSQDEDVTWTFSEYNEQHKQLSEWLEKIRDEISRDDDDYSSGDKASKKEVLAEELRKRSNHLKLFNDQSQRMIRRYPNLEHEIELQVEHINSCWKQLEETVVVHNPEMEAERLLKDIAYEMKCLRKWLRETETKLRLPALFPGCTIEDLEEKYKHHQTLQKSIESRGKNVVAVLKLCERLQTDKRAAALVRDAGHVQRVALNLEKRWHASWLRSLECHFVLEELIQKFRAGILPGNNLEVSVDDEPLNKYPRLSGEWSGNSLTSSLNPHEHQEGDEPENCEYTDDWNYDGEDGLTLDEMEEEFFTAFEDSLNISKTMKTREVGTGNDGSEKLRTNDKGVMVGTTGIADLKASHDGPFEPFEIIQDVGYSSESSTQLSNDERPGEASEIYSYEKPNSTSKKQVNGQITSTASTQTHNPSSSSLGDKEANNVEDEKRVVNRTGPNCATFHFRHVDTDPEYKTDDDTNPSITHSTPCKNRSEFVSGRSFGRGRNFNQNSEYSLGNTNLSCSENQLDSASSQIDWSMSEDDFINECQMTDNDKLRKLADENEAYCNGNKNSACQDAIHALVEQAERLVREESLTDLIGKRQKLEPLKAGEAQVKANRLKEWLRKQHAAHVTPPAMPPATVLDSSCDASGECTSNESDDDQSDSSEDQNNSVIMCQNSMASLDGTVDLGENSSSTLASSVKVVMRNKKRISGNRPWSVTELYQLTNRLDLSPFSISEGALNNLITASSAENSSLSNTTQKELNSPSSDSVNSVIARKNKTAKARRRFIRRSDSGSDNVLPYQHQGSSDCSIQKSPSRRRHSRGSKSHSSSSGGGKSAGHSSGTEHYSSEAGGPVVYKSGKEITTDSESEPTMIESNKVHRRQNEELSSLSEQAWDDYQEAPYLSEAYSEKLDDDMLRKLVNFGDDYSAFIESQSDSISVGSYCGIRRGRGRGNRNQGMYVHQSQESTPIDSDSDLEDLHHVIEVSSSQLHTLESRIRKHVAKEGGTTPLSNAKDYIELFATCQTNINCLQVIAGHLLAKPHCTSASEADIKEIKDTIHRWEKLRSQMQEQQSDQKLQDVEHQMKELQECMNNIDNSINGCAKQINSKEILERMIQQFQAYLSTLQEKKASLLTINVQVHSFMPTPAGFDSTLSRLKDDVASLYHKWDEVFEKGNTQLTTLRTLKSTWLQYEHDLEELQSDLRNDQEPTVTTDQTVGSSLLVPSACSQTVNLEVPEALRSASSLTVPVEGGINGLARPSPELLMQRQTQLSDLQKLARELETTLANTEAWDVISQALNSTAADLQRLQQRGRRKSSFLLPNSPRSDIPKRVRFSIAPEMDKPDSPNVKVNNGKGRSLLWRVFRAAVPIQFAIIVLLCVAYLIGPDCCDSRNNFVFSFSPHLRYVNGPPPV